MKLLLLTDYFPASNNLELVGGVEAYCFYLAKYLKAEREEVKVFSRATTGENWSAPNFLQLPKRLLFTAQTLMRGIAVDFDVVQGTNSATFPTAFLLGIIKRKPIIFWVPDVYIGSWIKNLGPVGMIGEVSDRVLFRMPWIKFIAISQTTKNKLLHVGVDANNVVVIPCGVDFKEINGVSKQKTQWQVCVVSRLLKYKQIDVLVRAVKIIHQTIPKIKVAIVGQGPEEIPLKKLALSLGVKDNFQFFSYLPSHKDVLKIIKSSRILCHPSSVEGFGISVVEAAALGKPTVVSNIPALIETTQNGKSGLVFSLGDYQDLASKIKKLLTNNKLYIKKSKSAKELAKQYSWQEIAQETDNYYKGLTS